jgi:hypothetical protein
MLLDGVKLFEYGPNCETCEFYMTQAGHAPGSLTVASAREALNSHCDDLPDDVVRSLAGMLPTDTYGVITRTVRPGRIPGADFYTPAGTIPFHLFHRDITNMVNASGIDPDGFRYDWLTFQEYASRAARRLARRRTHRSLRKPAPRWRGSLRGIAVLHRAARPRRDL